MLLHDIAKGRGGDHSELGAEVALQVGPALGLTDEETETVSWLVLHHLLLSATAFKRDIDDPKTIADFAATAGDPQRLRMLYLLTWADMRAVGPGVLTPWQATILHELYTRTLTRLTGGRRERPSRTLLTERLRVAVGDDLSAQAVKAHLAMMSERYLATTGVQRMAEHLSMLQQLNSTSVVTELFHHPDLGSSDLVVVTRDLPGLFSLIAGTLASQGVNIISAQIHTRGDGIAIDTFQVNDPSGDAVTSPAYWGRTLDALRMVLTGDAQVAALLEKRRAAGRAAAGAEGSVKITLDNHLSDDYTVLEVKCPDRLGLLDLVTKTLAGFGLDIATARIATEIDHAVDTFYVHDGQGRKVEDTDALGRVRDALEQALVQPI